MQTMERDTCRYEEDDESVPLLRRMCHCCEQRDTCRSQEEIDIRTTTAMRAILHDPLPSPNKVILVIDNTVSENILLACCVASPKFGDETR